MAIRKPFAAFGRVLYSNSYPAGELADFTINSESNTVLFFTEGSLTIRNKQTDEVVEQCTPGWFKNGNYQDGLHSYTVNESAVSWCYDPLVNKGYIPVIEPFILPQGQTADIAVYTNLFLCSGTLQVNGQAFVGPYQLSIRTGTATTVATTDVYGLLFK